MMISPRDIAIAYCRRGWNPVPIPTRAKAPQDNGWQTRTIDAASAPRFFNGDEMNIGVVLGPIVVATTASMLELYAPPALAGHKEA